MPVDEHGDEYQVPDLDPSEDDLLIGSSGLPPVPATSTGPGEASSDAPPSDQEPHPASDGDDEVQVEPLPEFDERMKQPFEGLLFLGRLQRTFHWMGHSFVIKTLNVDEILEVGLVHAKYVGTMGEVKAYQAAVVAASIVSVDGKPPPLPITNEASDTLLAARFEYVKGSWFPPTVDVCYEQYLFLEKQMFEVIEAMGKASGSTRTVAA